MRTNLEHIAKKLAVPSEIYSIRLIRPDVIMLRTLASCLIMFDSISNTNDWVAKQVPRILRNYGGKRGPTDADLPMILRVNIYA
jgi:anaphase-promoting complex subunit 1